MTDCVFCKIIRHEAPADYIAEWPEAVAFKPLNPVTPGHILVVPAVHVTDFAQNTVVTSAIMARAASLVNTLPHNDWNLITSKGPTATQTVYHLHVHLVPRRHGDGLHLPWTEKEAILARLDRVIELLEDIRDARRARIEAEITTLADPDRVYLPAVDE